MSKLDELRKLTNSINKSVAKLYPNTDRPAVVIAGDNPELLSPIIMPTGITALDNLLGGGLRGGCIHTFYGRPGSGKTSCSLQAIASIQASDPDAVGVYFSAEGLFPNDVAEIVGVDMNRLIVIDGFDNAEAGLDTLYDLLYNKDSKSRRNLINIVVIDSLAALSPQAEMEKIDKEGMAPPTMGLQAKLIAKIMRTIRPRLGIAPMICINQERMNVGSYAGGFLQPGGQAALFDPKVLIRFSAPKDGILTDGTGTKKKVIGHTVHLKLEKYNAGMGGIPGSETDFEVYYGKGVDNITAIFNAAIISGKIIETSAGRFQLTGDNLKAIGCWDNDKDEGLKFHGKASLLETIRSNDSLLEYLTGGV